MFAISYDSVEVLASFAEKHGITFPLLSDEGSRAIRALGLLNEQVQQHHAFYGIPERDHVYGVPYPGAFVLDERGVVTEKRFQDSYRERETGVGMLEGGFGLEGSVRGPEAGDGSDGVLVRAYLDSAVYRGFQRLRLTVELEIEPGRHLYGRPIPDGYLPLTIEVAPIDGLAVGQPDGPVPRPFRVEGLDEQFAVYEGRVRFGLPLTFREKVGDLSVAVTVRYQACSATDCFPPAAVQLRLPLRMESNVDSDR